MEYSMRSVALLAFLALNCSAASAPKFEDYPAIKMLAGKPAQVDFTSRPEAVRFQTRLIDGAKNGPNFAGEMTVVYWGCGTNCGIANFVSARDGKIFNSIQTCGEVDFRLNSRLLIINPPDEHDQPVPLLEGCEPKYFLWQEDGLVPIS
jgi:hypothetical protein